jgi:hypothetical protein
MKLLSISTLLLVTYGLVLGTYAWSEREPLSALVGILPVVLFMVVRTLDRRFDRWQWSSARRL